MTRFTVIREAGKIGVYDAEHSRIVHNYKPSQKKLAKAMAEKLNRETV